MVSDLTNQQRLSTRVLVLNEPSTSATTPMATGAGSNPPARTRYSFFLPTNRFVSGQDYLLFWATRAGHLPNNLFYPNVALTLVRTKDRRRENPTSWSLNHGFLSNKFREWNMHFRSGVARGSNRPTQAMPRISDVEKAESYSITGATQRDFETLDSIISSGLMNIVHGDLRKRVLSEGESSANIWVHDRESSRMGGLRSFQDQRHGRYSSGSWNSRTSANLRYKMGRNNRRDDIEIQRMRSWKTCTSDSETKRIRSNSHLRRTCKALFKRPNRTLHHATENGGSLLGPEDMRETCLSSWSSARKRHISL